MKLWLLSLLFCCVALHSRVLADEVNVWELNIGEWLPEQVPFKSIGIQADSMDAYILYDDGTYLEWKPSSSPDSSHIKEIYISGPNANLILTTRFDEKISVPVNSLALQMNQEYKDGRRKVSLDFSCLPEPQEMDENEEISSIIAGVVRALLFGGMDQIQLYLEASSDPSVHVLLKLGDGTLGLNFSNLEGVQKADWLLEAEVGENSVIMKRIVLALRALHKSATLMKVETEYEKMLKNTLEYSTKVADYLDIILKTVAGTAAVTGDVEFQLAEAGDFKGHLNNRIEFESTHENISVLVATQTAMEGGPEMPYQWSQKLVVSNPAQNLLMFMRWIRVNALTDLANCLNMPSITYYGYLGERFSLILVTFFESIGQLQEDGSILFSIARDSEGEIWVGQTALSGLGSSLYKMLKDKAPIWW